MAEQQQLDETEDVAVGDVVSAVVGAVGDVVSDAVEDAAAAEGGVEGVVPQGERRGARVDMAQAAGRDGEAVEWL